MRKTLLIFTVMAALIFLAPGLQSQTTCTNVAGFASNCVNSAAILSLENPSLSGSTLTITANVAQSGTNAIYKTGYYWNQAQSQWSPFTLTGTFYPGTNGSTWLTNSASKTLSMPTSAAINNVIYVATWDYIYQNNVWIGPSCSNSAGCWRLASIAVPPPTRNGSLSVPLTVKETAGVGSSSYPVSVIVPLPYGGYQNTGTFRVVNSVGATVPAQFEVLNRWWAKDNSIRHVAVHFQPTVGAFTGPGTGIASYTLKDNGGNIPPTNPVTLTDNGNTITLDNGILRMTVNRSPFKITLPTGQLAAIFDGAGPLAGQVQRSFDRTDVTVSIEESGPMRAVIRADAPTLYYSASNQTHGWAIRIYVYAGKSFVKVDYQLQNSAKTKTYSAPLYFKSLTLQLPVNAPTVPAQVRADMVTGDFSGKPKGALKAGPVSAFIRNFWQMWPNGLSVDGNGLLRVEFWPAWSAQFYQGQLTPLGLYWLDDMQQTYKETLLDFGSLSASAMSDMAKTFQYPPVVTLPVSWYADTKATLDLGGIIPVRTRVTTSDVRLPTYDPSKYNTKSDSSYTFGWNRFIIDQSRRLRSCVGGGWPDSASSFIATENPVDYFTWQDVAVGELNIRPQWIAHYKHATDWSLIQPSENPYCGETSWRKFDRSNNPDKLDSPYLPGSGRNAAARDDEHGWFYHVEEAYWFSGNPWIKDWYEFVGEFRKVRLNNLDPFPDESSRAAGHAVNHAVQAYRITGDPTILPMIHSYLQNYIVPGIYPTGARASVNNPDQEAVFQMGYLSRAIADYIEEINTPDSVAMNILAGFVGWNMNNANFNYYMDVTKSTTRGTSDGTSGTMADPQVWYAMKTGQRAPINHVNAYIDLGIPAGVGSLPYADLKNWKGDFHGRLTVFARSNP